MNRHDISNRLLELYTDIKPQYVGIICIGTELCIGDSLGPRVGTILQKKLTCSKMGVGVYGTVKNPIHATNLDKFLQCNPEYRTGNSDGNMIIAIDAATSPEHNRIGKINVRRFPLIPGWDLDKYLPSVGNIGITGVVTTKGLSVNQTFLNLCLVKKSLVKKMAKTIADGIEDFVAKITIWKATEEVAISK